MPDRFIVGLYIPWKMRVLGPWVLLVPTTDGLEFRARFGLHRFFGPWRVERAQVTKVFGRARRLNIWPSIGISGEDNLDWTIFTSRPADVLRTLEELDYPVDHDFTV